jgi:DNA-entry nuclease
MKSNRFKHKLKKTLLYSLVILFLGSCAEEQSQNKNNLNTNKLTDKITAITHSSSSKQKNHNISSTNGNKADNTTISRLQKDDYISETTPYKILNNDSPTTITKKDFNEPHIYYSALDGLNRVGTVTAYLDKNTLGQQPRDEQSFKPTGWNNQPRYINGKRTFPQNRGHLIAYSFSYNLNNNGEYTPGTGGSEDNPLNLFTQSAYSNQEIMQITENKVRNALYNNQKVIYKVTPIFDGDDLMAKGVWVQATNLEGTMQFNRYIYNIQPGIQFNYHTGRNQLNSNVNVPN